MARFFALDRSQQKGLRHGAAGFLTLLGATTLLTTTLRAQTMMQMAGETGTTNAAPAAPKAPVVAPANSSAKPPVPPQAPPPPVPDTFNRYGKIWAPSDDVAHPIKLSVQFPGVGEMKIPSQDELNVRDKLEQLAVLSDDDIRAQLALWPPYAKMKLADEGQLLMRIQQFKEQRTKVAMDKARDLGLLNSLTPDQKAKFEKEYWDKRLKMDHEMAKQFEPILKAREQKLQDELFREFSMPGTAIPAPPKPPAAPVAQAKPGTPPPAVSPPAAKPTTAPVTQVKPGASTNAPSATPPVAQGPTH